MSIPVVSVVAWSGTGKTTFLEKLLPRLRSRGLRVAVVKHDAHGFEMDKPGKDTWRMTEAGAEVSAIFSPAGAAILENRPLSAEEVVARIRDVDLILTEGCKEGPWPKLALLRRAVGGDLPVPAADCLAIVSDLPVEADAPSFGIDDIDGVAEFLLRHVNGARCGDARSGTGINESA